MDMNCPSKVVWRICNINKGRDLNYYKLYRDTFRTVDSGRGLTMCTGIYIEQNYVHTVSNALWRSLCPQGDYTVSNALCGSTQCSNKNSHQVQEWHTTLTVYHSPLMCWLWLKTLNQNLVYTVNCSLKIHSFAIIS